MTKQYVQADARQLPPQTAHYKRSIATKAAVVILCGLVGLLWTYGPQSLDVEIRWTFPATGGESTANTSDFSWLTAPTYKHLKYAPCYPSWGEFQCARLELPLDYWNGTTNETLSLAVIRKPAVV